MPSASKSSAAMPSERRKAEQDRRPERDPAVTEPSRRSEPDGCQVEHGEELRVLSRILGHSQLATTADVYAFLTPAMLERSAARMDAVLACRVGAATD